MCLFSILSGKFLTMNSLSAIEDVVLFLCSALCLWSCMLIIDRLYHAEGRVGVKFVLLHEAWLRVGEECAKSGSNTSKRDRTRSKNREATSTGYGLAGEDFQNTSTFVVVRSSVFVLCSAHKAQLARDAYNALWDSCRRSQVR